MYMRVEIDSVEYGLTDIQEYYANTGAIKKAAENNREITIISTQNDSQNGIQSNSINTSSSGTITSTSDSAPITKKRQAKVGISVIEAQESIVKPKDIESVLRQEYRTKLLNPKWSDAMLKQGSAGAYEISGLLLVI